jgi:phosphatidylglycerol:prolipoprotein diacylglycerol transferase
MSPLVIPYPNLDPVALQIGMFTVKWYGLAYLTGLVLGWLYIRRLLSTPQLWAFSKPPFPVARTDDLLLMMTLGVVLGGRLGFVLLYEPGHYLSHPADIVAVWKGGMAFHGALLGCGLAIWLFARLHKVSPFSTMDLCATAVPLGLMFGRIANFINGELWGRPTDVPWGMVFPEARLLFPAIEPTARHPSQLYESFSEGLLLFLLLRWLTHNRGTLQTPGVVTGVFLIGYAIARSACEEFFRQPHFGHALSMGWLTPGIAYSLPMIAAGLWFIWQARRRAYMAA